MGHAATMKLGVLAPKNTNSLLIFAIIIGCLNYGLGAFTSAAPATFTFNNPAFAWSVAAGQGSFYIPISITYASWVNTGTVYEFTTFTYAGNLWGTVGFSAVTPGSTMTLVDMGAQLSYIQSGGEQKIWCPTRGAPSGILGGAMVWDFATDIVTVTTPGAGVVTLIWSGGPPPPAVGTLDNVQTAWQSGDFLGGVTLIYTNVLGPAFYGVVILLVMLPLYFRTQSILLPLGVAVLLSGFIEIVMPAPALDFGRFLIIVGVAAGLFLLVTRGRSSS